MATALGGSALPERPARRAAPRSGNCASTATTWWRPTSRSAGDDVAAGVLRADLTDYGQATEVLRGTDAVVHLANIPAPGRSTPAVTFNANVTMNFNVFHAAAALGLRQGGVGVKRDHARPAVRPRPGAGPGRAGRAALRARSTRTTSRSRRRPTRCPRSPARRIAEQISRWSGIPFVGLRISNIMEPHDYERFPALLARPALPQVEPVGLRRRPRRRRRLPPRPGSGRHRQPERHHRRRRHGHEPPVPRRPRRGLPRRPAHRARSPSSARSCPSTAPGSCSATSPATPGAIRSSPVGTAVIRAGRFDSISDRSGVPKLDLEAARDATIPDVLPAAGRAVPRPVRRDQPGPVLGRDRLALRPAGQPVLAGAARRPASPRASSSRPSRPS